MCAYDSVVIWPAEDGDDRKKIRSHRLLLVITPFMFSRPSFTMSCVTFCHSSARPSSLSINMTRRARSILSWSFSLATADKKHALGINLSGLPVTQLRHTLPARYITCCVPGHCRQETRIGNKLVWSSCYTTTTHPSCQIHHMLCTHFKIQHMLLSIM